MKNITIFLACITVNLSFGQLSVRNTNYIYSLDTVIYIEDDVNLEESDSNFYLRGDAQVVQGAGSTENSGDGELSIYQNQTTGVYEYNYFCSPVGVTNSSVTGNLEFDGSNIHDPDDDTDATNVVSTAYLYTSAYEGTATELSNYWIYTLRDAEGYYNWKQIFDTGTAGTGYGFTLKGSPNANNVLDFRGRPNNGTITVSCAFDGTDNQPSSGTLNTAETLTGNPYPSALDLKLFFVNSLTNQSRLSGEIFFWEQKVKNSHNLADYEGGYGVYIPGPLGDLLDNGTYTTATFENYEGDGSTNGSTSGSTSDFSLNYSRRFAAIGQGFVVQSAGAGGDITFDNSMRVYLPEDSTTSGDGSIFAKNGNKKRKQLTKQTIAKSHNGVDYKASFEKPTVVPEIRIYTHIDNTFYKENVIAFRESTPNNNTYNRYYDGININELSNDTYLLSEDKALSIKSINYHESERIPLGIKASKDNTHYSIKINKLKDVPENVNIYVFDNFDNSYTDIKNNTLDINLDKGIYNNRFEITFNNNVLSTNGSTFESFNIFQNNRTSQLKLLNPNNLNVNSLSIYDVSGKLVMNDFVSTDKRKHSYSTKSFIDGLYIVKISLDNNQVFSKKIVIGNNN